jgi:glutathione S-transferase
MAESTSLTLFGARNSGHSYKVRLFLLLAGIPHLYRSVDLSVPRDRRPAEFRAVAKFGEVPVLVEGADSLVQSNAILLHLARRFGRFGASDERGWSEIASWLFWEANRIGRSYPNLRFYRNSGIPAAKGLLDWFAETAVSDLDRLDQELAGREFLLERFTIADISCAAYLLYRDLSDIDISRWKQVTAWLGRIRALPGFRAPQEAMARETADV